MALKYNYGQRDPMEYSRPGADSFNGRAGSQAPAAVRNQYAQPPKAASDPYSMFRESTASWYQPPSLATKPARVGIPKPSMDPAVLAATLRGAPGGGGAQPLAPRPQAGQNLIGQTNPFNAGKIGTGTMDPAGLASILSGTYKPAQVPLGKNFNNVDNPVDSGNTGQGPGTGPVNQTPGNTPQTPVDPPVTTLPGPQLPKPVTTPVDPPPNLGKPEKPPAPPPPPPGSVAPPTPPPTANREIPAPPALPPAAPNPTAPNTTPPPPRVDNTAWNEVFMPNIPGTKEITDLIQQMTQPANQQAQDDLARVLRGQAALTGDLNSGGFGNVLGREVGTLANQQQKENADRVFQFDQAARDRALEQYNTDTQRSTDVYRIDSDKFLQQLNNDTERYNIQTNADLERYLGDQSAALGNRQIDADQLLGYYREEMGLRGIQYTADRGFDRDALNAATERYLGDLNSRLGWGNLALDQYGIDTDAQIRLIQILQQSGLDPSAIAGLINSLIPGYAFTPGG